jgi:hypothetical protein
MSLKLPLNNAALAPSRRGSDALIAVMKQVSFTSIIGLFCRRVKAPTP